MMKKIANYFVFLISIPLLFSCSAQGNKSELKPKLMWFDATANFERFSYTDSIDFYLEKIKNIGFTHAVVDVRPISGEVLYDSEIAPKMNEWKGFTRPDFDFLGYFIKKAHALDLEVYASLNVFVAGHNFFNRGQIYTDHPEWASMVYNKEKGIIPITEEKKKYSAMVNPIDEDFREHIIAVLKEVVSLYPKLDGLILDRVRYDGITADFSDFSRQKFEEYLVVELERFPEDIYEWKKDVEGNDYPHKGKYYLQWLKWRSQNIYDFMTLAKSEVKSVNPAISFGTYTGAWYPSYFEVGVNFASKDYDPSEYFDWATEDYKETGYAELLDLFTVGNYYVDVTKEEYLKNNRMVTNETDSHAQSGLWYCVEGSCENLRTVLGNNEFYGGILVDQFYTNRPQLSKTIEMNLRASDGLMVFDIVHIINEGLWKEVEAGLKGAEQYEK